MMQPRDNKRARLPSVTVDVLGNDLLVRCASYLDADGLAQLGRTSASFGIPQVGQQRSLANEAARQRFRLSATDEERSRLPKYDGESDVGLLRALEQLRRPLCFDELAGNGFSPQEHPASVTCTDEEEGWSTAVSGHTMRGGRHFVEFEINLNGLPDVQLGVIRPVSLTGGIDAEADWRGSVSPVAVSLDWKPAVAEKLRSQRTAKWGESRVHCCSYFCDDGRCFWTDWDNEQVSFNWQGQEELEVSGTIGLLLDLNGGTLSVFKNGRRLGVMKEGLGVPGLAPYNGEGSSPSKIRLRALTRDHLLALFPSEPSNPRQDHPRKVTSPPSQPEANAQLPESSSTSAHINLDLLRVTGLDITIYRKPKDCPSSPSKIRLRAAGVPALISSAAVRPSQSPRRGQSPIEKTTPQLRPGRSASNSRLSAECKEEQGKLAAVDTRHAIPSPPSPLAPSGVVPPSDSEEDAVAPSATPASSRQNDGPSVATAHANSMPSAVGSRRPRRLECWLIQLKCVYVFLQYVKVLLYRSDYQGTLSPSRLNPPARVG
ncbi:hypothetical protein THAOC_27591, partial [Thalassiosira oceanica]